MPLQDEPAAKDIDNLLIGAKIIHEVDPAFQTTVTVATWSTRADIEKLAPAIDVWIPWEPRLTMRAEGPDELAFYQQQGKPFMTYLCSTAGNIIRTTSFRGIRASCGTDHFAFGLQQLAPESLDSSEDKEKSGASCSSTAPKARYRPYAPNGSGKPPKTFICSPWPPGHPTLKLKPWLPPNNCENSSMPTISSSRKTSMPGASPSPALSPPNRDRRSGRPAKIT